MKPIYFPFTYVSQQAADALAVFFKQVVVYQASARKAPLKMHQLIQGGFLDVRVPVLADQNKFDTVLKDFRMWANLQHESLGIKTASSQSGIQPIPFFDNSTVSQIVADIRGNLHLNPTPNGPDPAFCACVFLEFAQEYDRHCDEVTRDLETYAKKVQKLYNNIKGEDESLGTGMPVGVKFGADDPGEYMILNRLEAWTYLLQQDQNVSGLFITTSRSIFGHMLAKMPTAEKIYHSGVLPVLKFQDHEIERWQQKLLKNFTDLAEKHWPAYTDTLVESPAIKTIGPRVVLTVYLIPDVTPPDCFLRSLKKEFPCTDTYDSGMPIKNTLIGLIEF